MFWRGWFLVPVLLVGLLIAGAIGAAVAHHRYDDDDRGPRVVQVTSPANGSGSATTPQVIEIHDGGWRHHGGFFPGFFLFPLLFILLIFWLVGGVFRRGWRGGPWAGTGTTGSRIGTVNSTRATARRLRRRPRRSE